MSKILTILDYSNSRTIIMPDPKPLDYDIYILDKFGNITYYYMVGDGLEIDI